MSKPIFPKTPRGGLYAVKLASEAAEPPATAPKSKKRPRTPRRAAKSIKATGNPITGLPPGYKQPPKLFGNSWCQIIRALGKLGKQNAEAASILAAHGITMTEHGIATQLSLGRRGLRKQGTLTPEQLQEIINK